MSVPDRDGAIPGQSHMARGGMAGYASAWISIVLYTSRGVITFLFFPLFISRGGYLNTGTSQSLSGALNRQNQLMQGSGMQGGAFGRRY